MDDAGMHSVECEGAVHEVADRLAEAITAAGMTVFCRVDHGANATGVGLELRPTEVLIFGNPRAGTVLMQDRQPAGLDLPFKALVWEDETGRVRLTYQDPEALVRRYGLGERSAPVVAAIRDGMAALVAAAAGGPGAAARPS